MPTLNKSAYSMDQSILKKRPHWFSLGAVIGAQRPRVGNKRSKTLNIARRSVSQSAIMEDHKVFDSAVTVGDYITALRALLAPIGDAIEESTLEQGLKETESKWMRRPTYINRVLPGNYCTWYSPVGGGQLSEEPLMTTPRVKADETNPDSVWLDALNRLSTTMGGVVAEFGEKTEIYYKQSSYMSTSPPIDSKASEDDNTFHAYIDYFLDYNTRLKKDEVLRLMIKEWKELIMEGKWNEAERIADRMYCRHAQVLHDMVADLGLSEQERHTLVEFMSATRTLVRTQDDKLKPGYRLSSLSPSSFDVMAGRASVTPMTITEGSGVWRVAIGIEQASHMEAAFRVVSAPSAMRNWSILPSMVLLQSLKEHAFDMSGAHYRRITASMGDREPTSITDVDQTNHDRHDGRNATYSYLYTMFRLREYVDNSVYTDDEFDLSQACYLFILNDSLVTYDTVSDTFFFLLSKYALKSGVHNTNTAGSFLSVMIHIDAAIHTGMSLDNFNWTCGDHRALLGSADYDHKIRLMVSSDDALTLTYGDEEAEEVRRMYEYMVQPDFDRSYLYYKSKVENTSIFLRYNHVWSDEKSKMTSYAIIGSRLLTFFRRERPRVAIFPNLSAMLSLLLDCADNPAKVFYKEILSMIILDKLNRDERVSRMDLITMLNCNYEEAKEMYDEIVTSADYRSLQDDYTSELLLTMSKKKVERQLFNDLAYRDQEEADMEESVIARPIVSLTLGKEPQYIWKNYFYYF